MSPGLYSDSEEGESEDEELTEDDESYEDDDDDEEGSIGSEEDSDDYIQDGSNRSCSGSHVSDEDDLEDTKLQGSGDLSRHSTSSEVVNPKKDMPSSDQNPILQSDADVRQEKGQNEMMKDLSHSSQLLRADSDDSSQNDKSYPLMRQSSSISGRRTLWGRTSAKKNLSMESIGFTVEDEEFEIQKLEASKAALQKKIVEEAEGNAGLQGNLQERKKALRECRHALKQDVTRLREQLQMERERRRVLESGLDPTDELGNIPNTFDEKTKADLKEISQANVEITNLQKEVDKLSVQLIQLHEHNVDSTPDQHARTTHLGKSQKDTEATTAPPAIGKSTSKDGRIGRTKSSKDKKHESNINNTDPTQSDSSKFLKELRSQASANNELQNADKATSASSSAKNRGSDTRPQRQGWDFPDKGKGLEGLQEGCDNRTIKQDQLTVKTDSEPQRGRSESHIVENAQGTRTNQAPGVSRTDSR